MSETTTKPRARDEVNLVEFERTLRTLDADPDFIDTCYAMATELRQHRSEYGRRLLSINQVATKTSLSKSSINRLIACGDFPAGKLIGVNRKVWPMEGVDQWIEALFAEEEG